MPLKIPFGLGEDGKSVPPEQAGRNQQYRCPRCREEVIYKEGPEVRAHFSHHGTDEGEDTCSYETVLHHVAKQRLRDQLDPFATSAERKKLTLLRECSFCGRHRARVYVDSDKYDSAVLERDAPSGYRPDVALSSGGKIVAGFEVLVSSEVEEKKHSELEIEYVELEARDILQSVFDGGGDEDGGSGVRVTRSNLPRPFCRSCRKSVAGARAVLKYHLHTEEVAEGYSLSIFNCERKNACGVPIPVYSWPGFGNERGSGPPRPRSKNVHCLYIQGKGTYRWVNACPKCHYTQSNSAVRQGAFGEENLLPQILAEARSCGILTPPLDPLVGFSKESPFQRENCHEHRAETRARTKCKGLDSTPRPPSRPGKAGQKIRQAKAITGRNFSFQARRLLSRIEEAEREHRGEEGSPSEATCWFSLRDDEYAAACELKEAGLIEFKSESKSTLDKEVTLAREVRLAQKPN